MLHFVGSGHFESSPESSRARRSSTLRELVHTPSRDTVGCGVLSHSRFLSCNKEEENNLAYCDASSIVVEIPGLNHEKSGANEHPQKKNVFAELLRCQGN